LRTSLISWFAAIENEANLRLLQERATNALFPTFAKAASFPLLTELNFCYSPRFMPTEADTCRKLVVPKLQAAGWDNEPYSIAEQRTITDGRIVPVGKSFIRRPPKRVDYLLRYRRDFPLAVVEAKVEYKLPLMRCSRQSGTLRCSA
jgi:hypothetical protein